MNPATWDRVKSLLADAAARPAAERQRYVEAHCSDPVLQHEMLELLASPAPLTSIVAESSLQSGVGLDPDVIGAPDITETLSAFAGGRYVLVRPIGCGAEKIVFLVHDTALDRDCALALLRSADVNSDAAERFRSEARAIASLCSHPHIVTVFDIGVHQSAHLLVSEHLAGGDLANVLRDAGGRLPLSSAIDIARQTLRALSFVHDRGIVHRDLKPANVWLTPDGIVKLGDFGIAQLTSGDGAMPRIAGTVSFMSPEQLRGEVVDGRADLYALGCMMFELLAGVPPFIGSTAHVIAAQLSDPPPSLTMPMGVERINPIVRRLLAKNRDERPGSAADVLRLLDDALAGKTTRVPVPPAVPTWQNALNDALMRRDLPAALAALETSLAVAPDPEVRMALGRLLVVVDPRRSCLELERAVQEFLDAGLNRRAALAAAAVSASYLSGEGNRVAAKPWLRRAWRLVRDEGPCAERGWVAIFDIACNTDDPQVLRENCDIALEMARRFRDVALEAKALADGGYALVQLGDVEEGATRIDEAITIVTSGRLSDPIVVAQILCSFFTSVSLTGDLGRCEAWSRVFRDRGLVGDGAPGIVTSHCDSVYGALLCKLGRFSEAESALTRALAVARTTMHAGILHSVSSLAELRIKQGRLAEADALLRGHDDFMETLIPLASLHLARGAFDLAAATARRGLRVIGGDRTRAVSLLCVLVEAELGRGDLAAAQRVCALLDSRVSNTKLPALAAEAACVRARARAAAGDRSGAIGELETAIDTCEPLHIGPLSARLHVALARLHGESDPGAAVVEARAAASILARLDVVVPDEDLAFLIDMGAWSAAT